MSFNRFLFLWVLILSVVLLFVTLQTQPKSAPPPPLKLNHYLCDISDSAATATLNILLPVEAMVAPLANNFCHSKLIGENYNRVEMTWLPRDQWRPQDLFSQSYQVIASRPRIMESLLKDYQLYYQPAIALGTYSIYLFSNRENPQLSAEFFESVRFGILKDRHSLSSYQLPISTIKKSGADLSRVTLVEYESYEKLMQAVYDRQIDTAFLVGIPAFLHKLADRSKILITDSAPAGYWYFSNAFAEQYSNSALQPLFDLSALTAGKPQ
ncbi:hypothetical protein [Thiomicrorhabdus sp.]|uniref:hypothetical protein n=1 Tax=Thiomicrorhabdus sp. TaxID=2039724 RepID=UPI0029C75D09|nr:hypothetical protein [Thiomicrorhabdus sp.]